MNAKYKHYKHDERGIALFMAIFALMLLSAIAAGFMFLANTETVINSNYRQSQQAYFAARAGIQEARVRIMKGCAPLNPTGPANCGDLYNANLVPTSTMPTAANQNGGIYITNPAAGENGTILPWVAGNKYFDDTFCKANFGSADLGVTYGSQGVRCTTAPAAQWARQVNSNNVNTNSQSALLFKWARITLKGNLSGSPQCGANNPGCAQGTYPYAVDPAVAAADPTNNKPVCWNGFAQVLLPGGYTNCRTPNGNGDPFEPVYLLTSMAVTPGGSERTLSVEVADDPPFFNNSAVNSQDHVTLNGQLRVDGYDSCSCACAWADPKQTSDPTTYTCTSKPGKTCLRDKYAIYSNSTVDKLTSSEQATSGTTPIIAQSQSQKTDIAKLIDRYKNMAQTVNTTQAPYNYTCPPPPPPPVTTPPTPPANSNCGTHSGQTFGIPPLFPADGSAPSDPPVSDPALGTMKTQVTYTPGDLKITAASIGNGILVVDGDLEINGGLQFYGLIIVKGIVKFSGGGSDKTNIFGSVLAGISSVDDTVLGGSAAINYNQCALASNLQPAPPRLISSREIEY